MDFVTFLHKIMRFDDVNIMIVFRKLELMKLRLEHTNFALT